MASEHALWDMVRRRLSGFGVMKRIENRVDIGMPDVLYCVKYPVTRQERYTGLLELKHAPLWPKLADTTLKIEHFTLEQVRWAEEWSAAGGSVFFLLQVENEYMLFKPSHMAAIYAGLTRNQLMTRSQPQAYGFGRFPTVEIIQTLCRP